MLYQNLYSCCMYSCVIKIQVYTTYNFYSCTNVYTCIYMLRKDACTCTCTLYCSYIECLQLLKLVCIVHSMLSLFILCLPPHTAGSGAGEQLLLWYNRGFPHTTLPPSHSSLRLLHQTRSPHTTITGLLHATCTCMYNIYVYVHVQPTAPVLKAGHPGVSFFVVVSGCLIFVLLLLDCLSGLGGWESSPFSFHCLLAGVLCTCTSMYILYSIPYIVYTCMCIYNVHVHA